MFDETICFASGALGTLGTCRVSFRSTARIANEVTLARQGCTHRLSVSVNGTVPASGIGLSVFLKCRKAPTEPFPDARLLPSPLGIRHPSGFQIPTRCFLTSGP